MNRSVSSIFLGATAGASLGFAAGLRWSIVMAAASGRELALLAYTGNRFIPASLIIAIVIAIILTFVRMTWSIQSRVIMLFALSALLGLGTYAALSVLASVSETAWPAAPVFIPCVGAFLASVALVARKTKLTSTLVLIAMPFLSAARNLDLIGGDRLALKAFTYAAPPSLAYFGGIIISLGVLGAWIGWYIGIIGRRNEWRASIMGALSGAIAATCISMAQLTGFFVTMRTGLDPVAPLFAITAVWTALTVSIVLAARACTISRSSLLLRFAPVAVVLVILAYIYAVGTGFSNYLALSKLYPDMTYAYIHFMNDGTWRRTLDQSASTTRTDRARSFAADYPYSAYRPAAMVAYAQSLYEEWRFDDALQALAELKSVYPHMDGYADVLYSLSGLAGGRSGVILRPAVTDTYFAKWRRTQGAQMAAVAATKLGLRYRACGLHTAYIEYLRSTSGSSWRSESVNFSESKMKLLLSQMDRPASASATGRVVVKLVSPSGPVRGARVILVQPHPDAALPTDSWQFTGAWSIPAWDGLWALTDRYGNAAISGVPYGYYEVVIGLGFSTTPRDMVVASSVPDIQLRAPRQTIPTIRLARAVKLLSPAPLATIPAPVKLSWKSYPGAEHYSASIIALSHSRQPGTDANGPLRGTTCWTRANIPTTSAIVEPRYFVTERKALERGHSYMWIVQAYAPDGDLVSSSEHYFELQERTFTIR